MHRSAPRLSVVNVSIVIWGTAPVCGQFHECPSVEVGCRSTSLRPEGADCGKQARIPVHRSYLRLSDLERVVVALDGQARWVRSEL